MCTFKNVFFPTCKRIFISQFPFLLMRVQEKEPSSKNLLLKLICSISLFTKIVKKDAFASCIATTFRYTRLLYFYNFIIILFDKRFLTEIFYNHVYDISFKRTIPEYIVYRYFSCHETKYF